MRVEFNQTDESIILSIENHKNQDVSSKESWYERMVNGITEWAKPYLDKRTDDFIKKSIEKYAKDDETLAQMIEFEVNRRRNTGIPQDVTEPLLWTGIKTLAALGIAGVAETLKDGKLKNVGRISALTIILNNGVELFRLVNRYESGLGGGVITAQERNRALKETGIDPFGQGGRLAHKAKDSAEERGDKIELSDSSGKWVAANPSKNLLEMAVKPPELASIPNR